MKYIYLILSIFLFTAFIHAQQMHVHKNNATTVSFNLSDIDSITFTTNNIPSDGLVAYYPFNGNAHDESGNSNNCIATNCTLVPDRFADSNKAYSFNGSTSIITGPANTILSITHVSLSAWIKIAGAGTIAPRIVAVDPDGTANDDYSLLLNSSSFPKAFGFHTGTSGTVLSNTQLSIDNIWHHLVITYDESQIKFYLDGNLDKTTAYSESLPQFTTGHSVYIGGSGISGNDRFEGLIDDIRIYDRTLDQTEINALYHENGW